VQVESVAATVAAATAAGGKVLLPHDQAVLNGNIAVIGDPRGGVIGIIHWTSPDATEAQP
jgi:predicted enzyme related to lactoylglutathione lyase